MSSESHAEREEMEDSPMPTPGRHVRCRQRTPVKRWWNILNVFDKPVTSPSTQEDLVVVAIDTSGSTGGVRNYFTSIQKILDDEITLPLEVILWNHAAHFYPENVEVDLRTICSAGGTQPEVFVHLLKDFVEKFHLYIFTDGAVDDQSVAKCKSCLEKYDIYSRLIDVKLYYIGHEPSMNLKMTDIFAAVPIEIFINDTLKSAGTMDPNLNFDDVDYNFVMRDDTFHATVLSRINSGKIDRDKLRRNVRKQADRILGSISERDRDSRVRGQNSEIPSSREAFLRKMADIEDLFDEKVDRYSLRAMRRPEHEVVGGQSIERSKPRGQSSTSRTRTARKNL